MSFSLVPDVIFVNLKRLDFSGWLINAQASSGQEYITPKRLAAYILSAFGETDVEQGLGELDFGDAEAETEAATVELSDAFRGLQK
ncbi:MAG: hypothetical protein AAF629_21890 [Chloroflexota bacterium]